MALVNSCVDDKELTPLILPPHWISTESLLFTKTASQNQHVAVWILADLFVILGIAVTSQVECSMDGVHDPINLSPISNCWISSAFKFWPVQPASHIR
jgi:hypothetical protein